MFFYLRSLAVLVDSGAVFREKLRVSNFDAKKFKSGLQKNQEICSVSPFWC
jgi:hypothetical protein